MLHYVIFGHNSLLGEIVDIIHLRGGILTKIVQNIPEQTISGRKTLEEQIAALPPTTSEAEDKPCSVIVESLEQFNPQPGERYIMGFTGAKKKSLVDQLKSRFGINFDSLVHPSVIISPTVKIGEGALILAGSILSSGVSIGHHVFINKASTIGHDTCIGDYVTIQPGVRLSGYVKVDSGATLCVGAIILENILIGSGSTVAAGAVVLNDIEKNCMVAGVPAIVKKKAI